MPLPSHYLSFLNPRIIARFNQHVRSFIRTPPAWSQPHCCCNSHSHRPIDRPTDRRSCPATSSTTQIEANIFLPSKQIREREREMCVWTDQLFYSNNNKREFRSDSLIKKISIYRRVDSLLFSLFFVNVGIFKREAYLLLNY